MNLFHGLNNGLDVFDNMRQSNIVKSIGRKWVGKLVQIMDYIHPFKGNDIQTYAPWELETATPNV